MTRLLTLLLIILSANISAQELIGIDHIPIAVRDLDKATRFYQSLGFAIKPGRPHNNSIRNQHIKFTNGTELELITASASTDTLSTEYCKLLKQGEGPVFFGIYSTQRAVIARRLNNVNKSYEYQENAITFTEGDPYHLLFFGSRNHSPTDKPEHFAHTNTAISLTGVWLATDDSIGLLKIIGTDAVKKQVDVPFTKTATVATLKEGEIMLLPASYQILPGRPIIGATISISNLDSLKIALKKAGIRIPASVKNSITLPPEITHGLWLEFRQQTRKHPQTTGLNQ